jgi:hypothetical protein
MPPLAQTVVKHGLIGVGGCGTSPEALIRWHKVCVFDQVRCVVKQLVQPLAVQREQLDNSGYPANRELSGHSLQKH